MLTHAKMITMFVFSWNNEVIGKELWSSMCTWRENKCFSYGAILHHLIKSFSCRAMPCEMWSNLSLSWKILLHMINVLTQYQIFCDKRTFVRSKNWPKILVWGAKMSIRPSALGMSYPIIRSLEILEPKDSPNFEGLRVEEFWKVEQCTSS